MERGVVVYTECESASALHLSCERVASLNGIFVAHRSCSLETTISIHEIELSGLKEG
jgi:hypothetical protein